MYQNIEITENTSDGYHTFKELYQWRLYLQAGFFNNLDHKKYDVHKSKQDNDGHHIKPCFDGNYFVVMAELPTGQISNHYDLKYWDVFQIPEKEFSNVWDKHSSYEALTRLNQFVTGKYPHPELSLIED